MVPPVPPDCAQVVEVINTASDVPTPEIYTNVCAPAGLLTVSPIGHGLSVTVFDPTAIVPLGFCDQL
jgi:hypothetical protein